MTRQKSFKSGVRARMAKTGESYTTARRRILDKARPVDATPAQPAPAAAPEPALAPEPAAASEPDTPPTPIKAHRIPDASVRARTGKGWDEWFKLLDAWGATGRRHPEIARWLADEHGVEGWWSQSITVGYEQARGMRAPGQRSDGHFSAGSSRTVSVPVDQLFEAFVDPDLRERWLPRASLRVRTARAGKSLRADWDGGPTRIAVDFTAKAERKAHVSVSHERLADAEQAGEMKTYWRDRLTALKSLLEA